MDNQTQETKVVHNPHHPHFKEFIPTAEELEEIKTNRRVAEYQERFDALEAGLNILSQKGVK